MGGIIRGSPSWNLREWVPGQKEMVIQFPEIYHKKKTWWRKTDGFLQFKPNKETTLTLVLTNKREGLIECRLSWPMETVYIKVLTTFVKKRNRSDIKKDTHVTVSNCVPCQLLKAKHTRTHRHFRTKVFILPEQAVDVTSTKSPKA